MTAQAIAVAAARRGRPSTGDLADRLTLSRRVNANLRDELRATHREAVDFAENVRAHGNRIHLAVTSERPDLALHEGAAIVARADRFLRQRGAA